jgi:hypothetical protein
MEFANSCLENKELALLIQVKCISRSNDPAGKYCKDDLPFERYQKMCPIASKYSIIRGLNNIYALFRDTAVIENCHLIFVVPTQGQLNSKQNIITQEGEVCSRKSDQVNLFENNQWRLEYHLPS